MKRNRWIVIMATVGVGLSLLTGCGEVPIIAVSANAFDEDIKRSLASGMNAHISKPIEPGKLDKVIRQYARR